MPSDSRLKVNTLATTQWMGVRDATTQFAADLLLLVGVCVPQTPTNSMVFLKIRQKLFVTKYKPLPIGSKGADP